MSFDTSRYRFDPRNDYSAVVMEQGRVQLDSDWNEWLAQLSRRTQAGTLDTVGRAAYPPTTPNAFQITVVGSSVTIGPGRMYVDGLLAENHGDPTTVVWDPALAEMSNTPQPPPTTATGAIDFLAQPYYSALGPNATLPTASGSYLAYLDVWTRAVDFLQDPALVDPAVGVDTTGRLQTVWQIGIVAVAAGTTCGNAGAPWPAASGGRLSNAPIVSTPSGPCCLTDNTGYTGPENQHYRVEIHQGGAIGTATFKWSRDNASVQTGVTAITPVTNSVEAAASQLTVQSMGRDQVLGFAPGEWIEILNKDLELAGLPGELHRIDSIDFAGKTITLDSTVSATKFVAPNNLPDPSQCTRIRRWDQSGKVYASDGTTVITDLGASGSHGDIPVPSAGTFVILENGITVSFSLSPAGGVFNSGDVWTFAARTDGSLQTLDNAPPRAIHHHYVPLSIVDFGAGTATDCRVPWTPGGTDSCGCCRVTVGDGIESVGQFNSINAALMALPDKGGEVCILSGRYYEYVFIKDKHDVLLRGCGSHSRLASPSVAPAPVVTIMLANPNPTTGAPIASSPTGGNADGTFNAIVSISASQHIELRSLAVEASDNEVGILIDGTGDLVVDTTANAAAQASVQLEDENLSIVADITAKDIVLTASTLPAILAQRIELLHIDDNRVLMQNVGSLWPSVYVSGTEMHVDRNYVGVQSVSSTREWLPVGIVDDLTTTSAAQGSKGITYSTAVEHLGGIMIAGPSKGVYVCENQIEGGRFNGITLGNFALVGSDGVDVGQIIGVRTVPEDKCTTTSSLVPPDSSTTGVEGTSIVAGGKLIDIVIDANRISKMGLCGIGPVGLFELDVIREAISIQNLTITRNIVRDTLLRPTASLNAYGKQITDGEDVAASLAGSADTYGLTTADSLQAGSSTPYGAICVPAAENLVIRDNVISDFGTRPGAKVNGIFVLYGEMVDISRNQILETRDLSASKPDESAVKPSIHGGIILAVITPPTMYGSSSAMSSSTPVIPTHDANPTLLATRLYEPGMPALRVEENVVRIPLGQALAAVGFGPFAISNNHFACGGTVRGAGTAIAQTVLILNLGSAIESATDTGFGDIYDNASSQATAGYHLSNPGPTPRTLATSNCGTVLFSDNICQLETRADGQRSIASLIILSLDHVNFTGNHTWIDSQTLSAFFDAVIVAGSVNVSNNRFQESPVSVLLSGITLGVANITTQNISTFCLLYDGLPSLTIGTSNVNLLNAVPAFQGVCAQLQAGLTPNSKPAAKAKGRRS